MLHFSAEADFQEGVTSSICTNFEKWSGFRIISSINLRFASINFVACCFSVAEDIKCSFHKKKKWRTRRTWKRVKVWLLNVCIGDTMFINFHAHPLHILWVINIFTIHCFFFPLVYKFIYRQRGENNENRSGEHCNCTEIWGWNS